MLDSDVVSSRRNDIYDQLKACELRLKCLLMAGGGKKFQIADFRFKIASNGSATLKFVKGVVKFG
jgi:hypothetical protein